MLKRNKGKWLLNILVVMLLTITAERVQACHALPLLNTGITVLPNGIEVDADSDPATCAAGCNNSVYWIDIEVRCVGEPFNPTPFNPGYYGPLNTYPFFQSAQMNKPNCVQQSYPTTFIPFGTLCPGDYKVRFRENHNSQVSAWSAANTFYFTVPGTPPALNGQITAQSDTVCEGECTVLTAGVSGGCGLAPDYSWSTGSTNSQINVCPTDDSIFTVDITEVCSGTTTQETKEIIVIPAPDAGTASASETEVCEGETVDLTLVNYEDDIQWESAPNSGGPWTDIPGATADNFTSPPIDNTQRCFRARVGDCGTPSYSNEVCITVNPVPTVTVDDFDICEYDTIDIPTTVSAPGGDYLWEIDGTTADTYFEASPPVTTDYIVTYTLNNCEAKDTSTVTVRKVPQASIEVDSVCLNEVTQFTDGSELDNSLGDQIDQWVWDFGDGNSSTQQHPAHTYGAENVYDVELKITTNNGCLDSTKVNTAVYPLPNVDFMADDVCFEEDVDFTENTSVSNANTTNNVVNWNWDFDDGSTSQEENPTWNYDSDGFYDVNLSVETNNGCVNDVTKEVIVHPRPVVSYTADTAVDCSPLCVTLNSGATINDPSTMVNYQWILNDSIVKNGAESSYYECLENKSGDPVVYDSKLIVESNEGCVDSASINDHLTVNHNPIADYEFEPKYLDIVNSEAEFESMSEYADSLQWMFGVFDQSTELNPVVEYPKKGGQYLTYLLALTDEGCKDSIGEFIEVDENIPMYVPNTFTPDGDEYNETFKPIFSDGFVPEDFKFIIFNRWGEVVFESRNHLVGWDGTYGTDSGRKVENGTYVWKIEFKEIERDKRYQETGHVNLLR